MTTTKRHRLFMGICVVLLAAVVAITLAKGLPGTAAPAGQAAAFVPADALVYLNLSTDTDRLGTGQALELAREFPSYGRLRDSVLRRLSTRAEAADYDEDLDPWLGDEAAFTLLNSPTGTAGSLIILSITDQTEAEAFLKDTAGTARRSEYSGRTILTYGPVSVAFAGDQMLIGQQEDLRSAIDSDDGKRPDLAGSATFEEAMEDLPDDRVADAYASGDGVRRLLAPQPGLLGALGVLLDRPGLTGVGVGLAAGGEEARMTIKSLFGRGAERGSRAFEPKLLESVPQDALGYLGVQGLDRGAGRLLGLVGSQSEGLGTLLQRAQRDLGRQTGVNLERDVFSLLRGEVAVALLPAFPAPIFTAIARTPNEERTQAALNRLRGPLARLLRVPGQKTTFQERTVAGEEAFVLELGPGVQLAYAVFDGQLVLSSSLEGIRRVREAKGSLADSEAFQEVLGDRPKETTSLVFLDFRALLSLAERTGLGDDRAYVGVREDLNRVRAVGAATSGATNESTAELTFSIP